MSKLKPEVGQNDQIQGDASAAITIVEYGDYQCPYCGAAYPIVKEIQETFGEQIRFVFRNFPLSEIHQFAKIAGQAAEAASAQNKFWEMHDAIYENQSKLSSDYLTVLAENLGLDLEKFQADLASEKIKSKVEDDFESGIRSGVNGTPSFFVNGERFDGGATDLFEMLRENAS